MTERKESVIWEPQPGPQQILINCPIAEIFFGGSRGGGKTDGMIGKNAVKAGIYGKYQKGIFFRKELPQLEAAIERTRDIYGLLGWNWAEQKKTFTAPNGATLKFRPLEKDVDAEKYQGMDFTDIYMEEMTNYASPKPINRLRATLRSAHGIPCQLHGTGNPGGPGHHWVKARYIDPNPAGYEILTERLKNGSLHERIFIPSRLDDNQKLVESDPNYESNLFMSGSEALVRAWRWGDWNIVEGAFFDCWSPKMVLKPFLVPRDWTRIVGFDWGSSKPFSVGWWAVVPDDYKTNEGYVLPRGYLLCYRSWYGAKAPDVGLKMTAEAVGAGIKERTGSEKINDWVADPAIFKEDGGPSQAERMGLPFRAADNSRVARAGHMGGWDQMRSRMVGTRKYGSDGTLSEDGWPMMGWFNTCKDAIRTIPALQHDEHNVEDINSASEDHCFAGETLVDTPDGKVRLMDLPPSGKVFTERGIRDYHSARMTRKNTKVVKVSLSNGKEIICTPDHRFMLSSDTWRYARDLRGATLKCASTSYWTRFKNLMGFDTTVAGFITNAREYGYTAPFGNGSMAQYRPATNYTMLTKTGQTTRLKTSNVSQDMTTCPESTKTFQSGTQNSESTQPAKQQRYGTVQRPEGNGIDSTGQTVSVRFWSRIRKSLALYAESLISLLKRNSSNPNTVTRTVEPLRCVGVEELDRAIDVYCLTVPDTSTFCIEGGVVVHNCADQTRYVCMSRPWRAKPVESSIVQIDPWGRQKRVANSWKTL